MFTVGLDLGQRQDFSALAIVERREPAALRDWRVAAYEAPGARYVVRQLERIRLGTPYVDVVRRVAAAARHPALGPAKRLVVDATGVGSPVLEMLAAARPGCVITPVVITGGIGEHNDGRMWHVPKMDLMAGLRGMLEKEELRIARRMREAERLVRELASVQARVGGSGRMRVGADGSGEHDDLVMAVALACWWARKRGVGEEGQRLYW